jgi:hypothetical protein
MPLIFSVFINLLWVSWVVLRVGTSYFAAFIYLTAVYIAQAIKSKNEESSDFNLLRDEAKEPAPVPPIQISSVPRIKS